MPQHIVTANPRNSKPFHHVVDGLITAAALAHAGTPKFVSQRHPIALSVRTPY